MANAVVNKAANATDLTVGSSWVGLTAPITTDVGEWNGVASANNTIGISTLPLDVGALATTTAQIAGTISVQQPITLRGLASDVGTYSAGTGLYTAPSTNNGFKFERAVTVAANQTWTTGGYGGVYFGSASASGLLSIPSGVTLTKKGVQQIAFLRANTGMAAGSSLVVEEGMLLVTLAAATLGASTITLKNGTTFGNDASTGLTTTLSNPFNLSGQVYFGRGATSGFALTLSGPVTLSSEVVGGVTVPPTINVVAGSFGTSTPVVTSVKLTNAVTSLSGFTKAGAAELFVHAASPNVAGWVTVSAGGLTSGKVNAVSSTSDVFQNNGFLGYDLQGGFRSLYHYNNAAYSIPTVKGTGGFLYSTGALTVANAQAQVATDVMLTVEDMSAFTGRLYLWCNQYQYNYNSFVAVERLPTSASAIVDFHYGLGASTAGSRLQFWIPSTVAASVTSPVKFVYQCDTNFTTVNSVTGIYANQAAGATVTLTGGFDRTDGNALPTAVFTLGGGNVSDNLFSGVIKSSGGRPLGVSKVEGGKWILSGDNTHTGSTTVSAGTLELGAPSGSTNSLALQNSTLTYEGGTVGFASGITSALLGGLASTSTTVTLTIPDTVALSIGNNNAATTAYNGKLAGTNGFTKVGTGALYLLGDTSQLTGTVVAQGGTLTGITSTGAPGAYKILENVTALSVAGGATIALASSATGLNNPERTYPIAIAAGTGATQGTFRAGNWSDTTAAGTTYQYFSGQITGDGTLSVYGGVQGVSGARYPKLKTNSMPTGSLTIQSGGQGTTLYRRSTWAYGGSASASFTTPVTLDAANGASGYTDFGITNAGSGTLTLAGSVTKGPSTGTGTAATATLFFGTGNVADDTADIVVSGTIASSDAGGLGVYKQGSRKLTLAGDNTFGGNTTLSAGTLELGAKDGSTSKALQNSTLDLSSTTVGRTLQYSAGVTTVNIGGITSAAPTGAVLPVPAGVGVLVGAAGTDQTSNTFQSDITGSGTLTRKGRGSYTLSGNAKSFSGTLVLDGTATTDSSVAPGPVAALWSVSGLTLLPTVVAPIQVNAGNTIEWSTVSGTSPNKFSGLGAVSLYPLDTTRTIVSFNSGALAGLTGRDAPVWNPLAAAGALYSRSGLTLRITKSPHATIKYHLITADVKDFPAQVGYEAYGGTKTVTSSAEMQVSYTGTLSDPQNTTFYPYWSGNTLTAAENTTGPTLFALRADQADTAPALVITGGIERPSYDRDTTNTLVFTLSGTHAGDNTMGPVVESSAKPLALIKDQNGTWVLSGAGTHTGATRPKAGKLKIGNSVALQHSSLDLVSTDLGTLEFTDDVKLVAKTATIGGLTTSTGTAKAFTVPSGADLFTMKVGAGVTAATSWSFSGNITQDVQSPTAKSVFEKVGTNNTGTLTAATGLNNVKISAGTLNIGAAGTAGTLGAGGGADATKSYGTATVEMAGGTLAFNRTDATSFDGVLTGTANTGALTKATGAAVTITLTGDNAFRAPISVSAGALRTGHANALGIQDPTDYGNTPGAVAVSNNCAVLLSTTGTNVGRPFTLVGTGLGGDGNGALRATTGAHTISGLVTAATSAPVIGVDSGATLTLSGGLTSTNLGFTAKSEGTLVISGPVTTGTGTVTKTGAGRTVLSGAAGTYTGATSVSAGTLAYTYIANSGTNSSLGTTGAINVANGAVLEYAGAVPSKTTRAITFSTTGAATGEVVLSATGAGPVEYVTHPTVNAPSSGTKTLVLDGTSTAANTISATLNLTTAATPLEKRGNGVWVLSKPNVIAGDVTVKAGRLVAASEDGTARFGTALGGATQKVVVKADARIQTLTGSLQKGRHQYANLTFEARGGIRIGGTVSSGAIQMNGDLNVSAGQVTWDLSDPMYRIPGTYTLVVFITGALVGPASNIQLAGVAAPLSASLSYNDTATPYKTITVTISAS